MIFRGKIQVLFKMHPIILLSLMQLVFVQLILLSVAVYPCRAADSTALDKNGVSPNTISLPSGPGSIEGLGEAFQPMLNTGMARYEVKITLPGGVSGHTPGLSLRYDSGQGDGPAGIGWKFGPGSISRQSEKGIPRYVDGPNGHDDDYDGECDEADEVDTFIGLEEEELVALDDGTYRARIEGTFIRYSREGDHWVGYLKDGSRLEFGLTPAGRVSDAGGARVYRWLLEKNTDTNGNVIEYHYTAFPGSDNQKYLREIRYGPGSGPWGGCYFVSLTYEERPDWRKDYRSGFMIKTAMRLAQIDIGIQGANPPQCAAGDWNGDGAPDALIRRYRLSYGESGARWSYLSRVTQYGSDGINYLPPISFSYTTFEPQVTVSAKNAIISSGSEPFTSVMDSQTVELIDLNRDGLPDLLKTDPYGRGVHTCYLNQGIQREGRERTIKWAAGKPVGSEDQYSLQLNLSENQVHLADMDGDGISDLVHTTYSGEVYYYRNQGNLSWARRKRMSIQNTSPPAPFGSDQVMTSDIDFNKKIDIVRSTENGYSVWFNLGDGKYSREVRTAGAIHMGQVLLFSDSAIHMADMNGDRMGDVVRITPRQVIYCANMGHGRFDLSTVMSIPDHILTSGQDSQVSRARLQDINGDGLSDLVIERAEGNALWYWLNLGTDTFSKKYTITQMPVSYGPSMVTRWADLNGNGTSDLIYADSSVMPRLRMLDIGELAGGSSHPNMLASIDNGLGGITRISYRSSTEYYQKALLEGKPWSSTLPFPVSVVAGVETTASLDLDGVPGKDRYLTEFIYADGYYDEQEKAFRGFATVKVIERGDESAPTQVQKHHFFTGGPDGLDNDGDGKVDEVSSQGYREDEPLKGMVRDMEVRDESDLLFTREENSWLVKTLLRNPAGIEVQFACKQEIRTLIYEGTTTPETLRATYVYDDFGNTIEEKNYGALSISGDEVFTYTQYIYNTDQWILNNYSRRYQTDSSGKKVTESRRYYDGEACQGLAPGLVTRGNLSREEAWIEGERYCNLVRNAFDSFGNVSGIMDANGNRRSIAYDSLVHIFPVSETIHLGGGSQDLAVRSAYNPGLGTMVQSTDFNGHTTSYAYDSFGRLVKVIKQGDSSSLPTKSYSYTIADPNQGLIYSYDEGGTLTLTRGVATGSVASSVTTKVRENSGLPGTFDTVQYFDGLNRKLAVVEESEQGFVVKDAVLFNSRASTRYAFLPYSASSREFQPPSLSSSSVEMRYDATGREIIRINPPEQDGTITQASTQYLPLQKRATDENHSTKIFISDGLERMIEVHEKNDNETYITRYEYDSMGNLIKVTDAQNNVRTMSYDGIKRKTEARDPDYGRVLFEYDDAGNLIKTTDNKGQVILYTFDGANRILSEDYQDGAEIVPGVAFHYDAASADYPDAGNVKGALSWISDLSGALFFSYDQKGNIVWKVKRIDEGGFSSSYKTAMIYDAMNRVTSMTYPDGEVIHYTYNNRSLLESIPGVVEGIDYTVSGQLDALTCANGIKTSYAYDQRQRLSRLETKIISGGNDVLQHLSYTMDGVSNITALTDERALPAGSPQNASQKFSYDDLHRLTRAEGAGYGVIHYQYDKIGNMTLKKSPDAPDHRHIDDPVINLGEIRSGGTAGSYNRTGKSPGDPPGPHAITGTESGLKYDYDDNGNMISNAQGDLYSWDFHDRLIRVRKGAVDDHGKASTDAYYVYDYSRQRVIKKVRDGSGEKVTLYVGKEYEIREGKAIKYVFAGKRRVCRIEGKTANPDEDIRQTLHFYPGWNFFSLEGEPENPEIGVVLGAIKDTFAEVWAFDPVRNKYLGYVPNEGIYDLTELHAQKGYLIRVTAHTSMEVTGIRRTDNLDLPTGWNLIGCPAQGEATVEDALASIAGKYVSVWDYDPASGRWRCFFPGQPAFFNDLYQMEPGRAYWVEMKMDGQLAGKDNLMRKMYFYHPDHLGSSSLVTNMDGDVVERTELYPFGLVRYEQHDEQGDKQGNKYQSLYRFTGKERDAESGLDYFEARYYLPVVGRFISADPVEARMDDPREFHKYAYCKNNPVNLIDPLGLQALVCGGYMYGGAALQGGKVAGGACIMLTKVQVAKVRTVAKGFMTSTVNGGLGGECAIVLVSDCKEMQGDSTLVGVSVGEGVEAGVELTTSSASLSLGVGGSVVPAPGAVYVFSTETDVEVVVGSDDDEQEPYKVYEWEGGHEKTREERRRETMSPEEPGLPPEWVSSGYLSPVEAAVEYRSRDDDMCYSTPD